jgi:phage major head subunit gpT-like protein
MNQPTNSGEWIRASAAADTITMTAAPADLDIQAEAPPADGKKAGPRKFTMTAYTGGAMQVGAFSSPIVVDFAGLDAGNSARPILIDHENDLEHLLGQTDSIEVKDGKLMVAGSVYGESPTARQVLALNDKGFKFQASIGARVLNREFVPQGSDVVVNGRTFNGPINVARKSVLGEVSFVVLGADDKTSAKIAATHAAESEKAMSFQEWLAAMGLSIDGLTAEQKTKLEAKFNAEKVTAKPAAAATTVTATAVRTPEGGSLDSVLAAERKKADTRKQIVDLTAKALQDSPGSLQIIEALSRQAMEGDWDTQRYELELLRATRPQAANVITRRSDEGLSGNVIEAAVCLSGGMERTDAEKRFSEQALEAADKRWRHGLGLGELLMLFARRNGHDALSTRNVAPLLKAAFAEPDGRFIRAEGISTLSLPGILSNVANKFLRMGFDAVESTWRAVSAIRPVNDFKQVTSYSLTGDFEYVEVPPGGELKHANVGEKSYTNQAKTYGRLFAIDRRDIINDDLGSLTQVPKRIGRGGALKFNTVFWTAFMNNSTFFASGNANYLTGVTVGTNDSRCNIEGLTRAEQAFFDQTDPDGKPMGATPRILLVPNSLNATASTLMRSAEVRNTTANTIDVTGNPHAGKFDVVRSSYLSNSAFTGYSTTAWYLLADPNDVPVIESAFLNGVEAPTVESADADFNVLGIQMRGFHDFGVALQEYRGGVKSKGAS